MLMKVSIVSELIEADKFHIEGRGDKRLSIEGYRPTGLFIRCFK